MKKAQNRFSSNGFFQRYKELIVTTIICLFLTGIYDSINNQTAEIKKWYQLMISVNEKVKIQAIQLGKLEKSIESHVEHTTGRFKDHNDRIRSIEFEVLPYKLHIQKSPLPEDTTHARNH